MKKMKKRNGSPGRLPRPESRLGRPDVQSRLSARDRRGWGQTPTEGRGSVPDDSPTGRAVHIRHPLRPLFALHISGGLSGGGGSDAASPILESRLESKNIALPVTERGLDGGLGGPGRGRTPASLVSVSGQLMDTRCTYPSRKKANPRREQQAPSTPTPHANPGSHPETNRLRIVPRRTAAQIGTPRHWQTPRFSPSVRLRVSPLLDNPERAAVVGPGPPAAASIRRTCTGLPPFPPPTYPLPSRPVCTGHCHVTCHVRASFHHARDLSNGQEA